MSILFKEISAKFNYQMIQPYSRGLFISHNFFCFDATESDLVFDAAQSDMKTGETMRA